MLPSIQRLSRPQVSILLANPAIRVVFNRLGTLKYLNHSNITTPCFTVVTGSKQQKKAVARNKVRRQLYSLLIQHKQVFFTGMLYVSKNIYGMPYNEIKQHFYRLLEKV
jgi:ribonuclease P protein component